MASNPAPVPLQLTAKERSTLAMILGLLVLGLIGMAVLRDEPAKESPTSGRTTASDVPTRPRSRP